MEITYKLHDQQLQVFKDSSRFIVVVAGRRFGKTTLALIDIIASALANFKSRVWYIAPTYRQAEMIAWKMLLDMIPPEIVKNKNEARLTLELLNKSEISLKGADNEDSLRGAGLDFVVLDEYAQMKSNVWQEIIRPMLTDTKGRALFIGTPKGKNRLWEQYIKGQRKEDGYSSYLFKTIDNPYIDPKEIEEAKSQLNERYFRQEYEASFEDYTGIIYPEFNQKIHLINDAYLPSIYQRIGAIDTAITGTTGVLKAAIDEDGNMFIYQEYYKQNKRASEVAEDIKEEGVRWFIDPEAHKKQIKQGEELYSLADEYNDYGIHTDNAQKDVYAGINRVAEYFKQGKIKIFKSCKNLITELERYHWSEERETLSGMTEPKPFKANDHLCDCLRYIIFSRPKDSVIKIEEKINPNSAWGQHILNTRKADEHIYGRLGVN